MTSDTLEVVDADVVVNDKRNIAKDTYGEFLRLLHVRGGEAFFSTLREAGGFSRSQVNTRRENLTDAGLVDVEKREGYNSREEYFFELTEDGRSVLEEWTEATEGVAQTADRESRAVTVKEWEGRGERISDIAERTEELQESLDQLREAVEDASGTTADTTDGSDGLSQSEVSIVASRVRDEIGVDEGADVGGRLDELQSTAEGNRWVLNNVVLPWMEWVEGKVTAAEWVAQSVDSDNYFKETLPKARETVREKFDAANPWKETADRVDNEL